MIDKQQAALQRMSLDRLLEFAHPGDTSIHRYGWRKVLREMVRRLEMRNAQRGDTVEEGSVG